MTDLIADDDGPRLHITKSTDPERPLALWVLPVDGCTVNGTLTVQRANHLGQLLLAHVASIAAGPPTGGVT